MASLLDSLDSPPILRRKRRKIASNSIEDDGEKDTTVPKSNERSPGLRCIILMSIFKHLCRVFNVSHDLFEVQLKHLALYSLVSGVSIIMMCYVIFLSVIPRTRPDEITFFDFWSDKIITAVVTCCLFLLLMSRIFIKSFKVFLCGFNLMIMILVLLLHHYVAHILGGGVMGGPIHACLFLIVTITVVFGNIYDQVFWIFSVGCACFSCYIRDVITVDVLVWAKLRNEVFGVNHVVLDNQYMLSVLPLVICCTVLMGMRVYNSHNSKVVREIGSAVLALDFTSKLVKKLENKDPKYSTSFENLLKKVIVKMKMFKKFLPDSVKQQHQQQHHVSDDSDSSDKSRSSKGSSESLGSSFSRDSLDFKNEIQIEYGITSNNEFVVMLCTIQTDLDDLIKDKNCKEISDMLRGFIDCASRVVHRNKGSINDIGDSFMFASFNAQRKCVSYSQYSIECAFDLKKDLRNILGMDCRITLMYSESLMGHINSTEYSKFLIVGPDLQLLYEIDKLNRFNRYGDIIVCDGINRDIHYRYQTKIVDYVKFKECTKTIYEVVRCIAKGHDDEWMYEISKSLEGGDDESEFNIAAVREKLFAHIKNEEFENAESLYKENEVGLHLNMERKEWQRLWDKIQSKESYVTLFKTL